MHPSTNETSEEPLLEQIAEQIMARQRRGEQPTVEEYCKKYPDIAEELRTFLPALLAVERLKDASVIAGRPANGRTEQGAAEQTSNSSVTGLPASIGGYRIIQEIGRGGMGVVYEAEQPSLGRRVALKVLTNDTSRRELTAQRFASEARAAAALHHTNVVPVFDVGADEQYLYYSMQLIRGQSLAAVIEQLKQLRLESSRKRAAAQSKAAGNSSPLDPLPRVHGEPTRRQLSTTSLDEYVLANQQMQSTLASGTSRGSTGTGKLPGRFDISTDTGRNERAYYHSVANVGHQIAAALAYVHERGIVHRDIKPSNLLLDGSGTVWLTDFGLAKTSEFDLTHTGDILGTLRYMAPERFKGHCDGRADTYSLGLTLYELIALEPAFTAADYLNLINKISRATPVPLKTYDANIPQDLETIILKSISKDPRFRYASAGDMADDLQSFMEDRPIRARRVSPLERLYRWSRQNRLLAGTLFTSAALLIVVTIASMIFAGVYKRLVNKATQAAAVANGESQRANESARRMSDYLYVAHMQMAGQAWQAGAMRRVRELLDKHIPQVGEDDRRGQDWSYLDSLCQAIEDVPTIDYGDIAVLLSIDPRSRFFVVSGNHGAFHVYDTQTLRLLQATQAHESKILVHQLADDGQVLITMDWERLKVWSQNQGQFELLGDFAGFKPFSTRVTDDGRALLIPNHNAEVFRWEFNQSQPKRIVTTHSPITDLVTRSDNQRFIVALEDGTVEEYDALGKRQRTIAKFEQPVRTMNTTEDGRYLVAANEKLRLVNLQQAVPTVVDLATTPVGLRSLEALRDMVMVSCSDRAVVWNYAGDFVTELKLGADFTVTEPMPGERIVVTGFDNFINVYSTRTWEQLDRIAGHNNTVYDVRLTDDDRLFSIGRDGLIRVMDRKRLSKLSSTLGGHQSWLWCVRFSPDSKMLATASRDGNVILWDTQSGLERGRIDGQPGGAHAVGFSPDGKLLAVGGWAKDVHLYDSSTLERVGELKLHQSKVNVTHFSPNGRLLLTGGDDGRAVVWDVAEREAVAEYRIDARDDDVWTAAFANDEEVVFGGTNDTLYRWRFIDGSEPQVLLEAKNDLTSSRFSHDGKSLAVTSADGGITLIDYASQEILMQPTGHASDAMHTAFSPDDRTLISAGSDGSVVFWSLTTYEPTVRINAHNNHVQTIDFSPDGTQFATGSWDSTAKLWQVIRRTPE